MPTATPSSSQGTPSDDASRADRGARPSEGGPVAGTPKPAVSPPEVVDVADNPYDNVACTD